MQCILFKTSISLQPYKSNVYLLKSSLFFLILLPCILLFSNIEIMYILCMVIPTKVDTSQVPQQNVN